MRLLELQNEQDSVAACAAAGRAVADENLRGWAALLPLEARALAEGLRQANVPVLRGALGALALGSIAQLWSAARSLATTLEREGPLARELMERAQNVESPARRWVLPRSALPQGRTLIIGIVNCTPDSFSDGGAYEPLLHARDLIEEGADILDLGGESTRPDAQPIDARTERERVEPVLRALKASSDTEKIPLSIDTTKSEVARAAIELGAEIVNDVSGLARDPRMAEAAREASLLLMHMRGTPQEMASRATYADLHGEVLGELELCLRRAIDFPNERVALDPGLGFAKAGAQNFALIRRLRELAQLGHPLVVGASRKSFIGKASGVEKASERLHGSVAAAVAAALNGAFAVRVHDVKATREALAVADAIRTSRP